MLTVGFNVQKGMGGQNMWFSKQVTSVAAFLLMAAKNNPLMSNENCSISFSKIYIFCQWEQSLACQLSFATWEFGGLFSDTKDGQQLRKMTNPIIIWFSYSVRSNMEDIFLLWIIVMLYCGSFTVRVRSLNASVRVMDVSIISCWL